MRVVYENIYFAIGIKVLCLILGAFGMANMWLAIFADVGVMVLAVLNAIRVLFVKSYQNYMQTIEDGYNRNGESYVEENS